MKKKNFLALFSFVVSIEPAEEPIEIEEPGDGILWMTDLLREWAAQGLICSKMGIGKFSIPDYFIKLRRFSQEVFLQIQQSLHQLDFNRCKCFLTLNLKWTAAVHHMDHVEN